MRGLFKIQVNWPKKSILAENTLENTKIRLLAILGATRLLSFATSGEDNAGFSQNETNDITYLTGWHSFSYQICAASVQCRFTYIRDPIFSSF